MSQAHSHQAAPSGGLAWKNRKIIAGTRGSALAQWQTDFVIAALKGHAPELSVERQIIKTSGDKDQTRPLAEIGGLGVFTKEIENALLTHEIDLAVHSLKDLPTELASGLRIAAITEREDARDCVVSRHGLGLMQLPSGARVGTSSARRAAQVLALRPDLQIVPLRGNVDTRLRKAQGEDYDAVVIAAAGLIRLGRANEITEYLSLDLMLPDPGQGALAVEIRADDHALAALLSTIDHRASHTAVTAERSFLKALGGGCRMPIAAYAGVDAGSKPSAELNRAEMQTVPPIRLRGMVASLDGKSIVRGGLTGDPTHAEELGAELARRLLGEGGAEILGDADGTVPLRGRRIVVTRAREQANALADRIRALGGEPVEFPAIDFAPLEDFRAMDAALGKAGGFDWIVFTSANGVHAAAERLRALSLPTGTLRSAKLAAIGPATAGALKGLDLPVDFVPTRFLGEQIAIELPVEAGQRALLLRADIASEGLARGLVARGVAVTNVDAYRTIKPASRSLDLTQVDAITFTSSSTARNFIAMVDGAGRHAPDHVAIFCIGPVTADTARELGLRVDAVANEHTIEGLVSVMAEYYRQKDNSGGRHPAAASREGEESVRVEELSDDKREN